MVPTEQEKVFRILDLHRSANGFCRLLAHHHQSAIALPARGLGIPCTPEASISSRDSAFLCRHSHQERGSSLLGEIPHIRRGAVGLNIAHVCLLQDTEVSYGVSQYFRIPQWGALRTIIKAYRRSLLEPPTPGGLAET